MLLWLAAAEKVVGMVGSMVDLVVWDSHSKKIVDKCLGVEVVDGIDGVVGVIVLLFAGVGEVRKVVEMVVVVVVCDRVGRRKNFVVVVMLGVAGVEVQKVVVVGAACRCEELFVVFASVVFGPQNFFYSEFFLLFWKNGIKHLSVFEITYLQ